MWYRRSQGSYVLNNFMERLSGQRLYARLHDVLLDTGVLHALQVVDADWPATPPAPQASCIHASIKNRTRSVRWTLNNTILRRTCKSYCAVYILYFTDFTEANMSKSDEDTAGVSKHRLNTIWRLLSQITHNWRNLAVSGSNSVARYFSYLGVCGIWYLLAQSGQHFICVCSLKQV